MRKLMIPFSILCLLVVLTSPACKSFVWDPSGMWSFSFNFPVWSWQWTEQLTLTGSESGGTVGTFTVDGWTLTTGSYTKTGDYSLTISFDYWESGWHETWNISLTSSEGSPNIMSGSAVYNYDGWTDNGTVLATKISNLQ